ARLVAGVVLLIGAFAVPRRRRRDRAPSLRYVTVAAIVVGILVGMQVIVWFQSSSLPRVAGAPAAVSSLSSVTVADVFLQSLGAALRTSWDTLPEAQRRAALDGLVDQSRQLGALAASAPEIAELRMDIYSLEREPQSVREVLAAVDRAYSHLGARLVLADDD